MQFRQTEIMTLDVNGTRGSPTNQPEFLFTARICCNRPQRFHRGRQFQIVTGLKSGFDHCYNNKNYT